MSGMQTTQPKNTDKVIIAPHKLNYGVISAGFLYNLKFTVQNNTTTPMRIRVACTPLKGESNTIRLVHLPDIIAPGLATTLLLELTAEFPMSSRFLLTVTQNHTSEVFSKEVEANIVTTQTFKHVKKSLVLQKRPIYQANVRVVANIPDFDTMMEDLHNYSSSATFSEAALLDEDDIDDLLSLPMVHNVYWDPFSKCLRLDPALGKVLYSIHCSKLKSRQSKITPFAHFSFCLRRLKSTELIVWKRTKSGRKQPGTFYFPSSPCFALVTPLFNCLYRSMQGRTYGGAGRTGILDDQLHW